MKIGTLTFHRAQNYGGVLQCYALIDFLRQQGFDAEVIDYRCRPMESIYKLIKMDTFGNALQSVRTFVPKYKARRLFDSFRFKYIPMSSFQIHEPRELIDQYDVTLVGSDQVWCPRIVGGIDPVYFGDYSEMIRKVSYAASDEQRIYTEEQQQKLRKCLAGFSNISVREDVFAEELRKYTDKEIVSVCDPTLLLTKEDYMKIAEDPNKDEYVLYYQQVSDRRIKNIIIDTARQIGAKKVVVVTGPNEKYDYPKTYYNTSNLSVNKFLGLFKNAKCVFTTSFHGTAFSIVFRKDFYFVDNSWADRSTNLLSKVGLLDRLISPEKYVKFSKVDYSKVEQKIDAYRSHSMKFLNNALNH